MLRNTLSAVLFATISVTAADVPEKVEPVKTAEETHADSFSLQLLNAAKSGRTKLQAKQDNSIELKAIITARKTIDAMRLKAAADFAKQQAALDSRKADKAALTAFETQRKAMNTRFNELARLIDQVNKNQKTPLLSEKLNDLIVFLEPAASATAQTKSVKAPPKKLSRGVAPVKQGNSAK